MLLTRGYVFSFLPGLELVPIHIVLLVSFHGRDANTYATRVGLQMPERALPMFTGVANGQLQRKAL